LLTLALRVLTLTEFVVREALQRADEALVGLYPGQPSRRTDRPTTERLLKVFKGINLSLVALEGRALRHLTPLSSVQQAILALLGLSTAVYTQFTAGSSIPP
jgi:transposase